ncbi:FadR/GntR family transcriptional regulator [Tropicimonas isoalkanivorans]|uniref:Transcriptional regulator, GntR family n=1 Tax=Tropicimonas isoalkanivorans TaxID=441112 RepID=A0A1I1LBL8_9RHOB|nr:FCD domain-containing protein [Tropicimonas isoalkanivorans]SFC66930.1 transcriptional regulator, GntR family [Tropicimonas isoalkanivorans]
MERDITPPATTLPADAPRMSRPQIAAAAIKDWVVERGMRPGDRLPGEAELMAHFGMAKGTIREALRVLEAQGLIRTRTGPGGGAFVNEVSEARARALLGNYFYFQEIGVGDIYALRHALEPVLVAQLAGTLPEERIVLLEEVMTAYETPPETIEESERQRMAELDFHALLASFSPNPLLRFQCRFLIGLLKDITICRRIYRRRIPGFRAAGRDYQSRLIQALRAGDGGAARAIMRAHMTAAQKIMEEQESVVLRQFLSETDAR